MVIKRKEPEGNKYMGTVKVGPKGQIVIPKDVRDMFDINPGDSIVILADSKKGVALHKMSFFSKLADKILSNEYTDEADPDSEHDITFAKEIKNLKDE